MLRTGNESLAPNLHFVLHRPLQPPFPEGTRPLLLGMGCFWGAERGFWKLDGVFTTAVGYAGGTQPDPTYEQVCTGTTGHAEVVLVVYEDRPEQLQLVLETFWQSHDPTQGMRQGNDVGTQYRSAIFVVDDEQRRAAEETKARYQVRLAAAGYGEITTEIAADVAFYYAEDYHQQYLAKNPAGYCGLGGTGVRLRGTASAVSAGTS
jgi:peptide-methionine (S)-S-oxide reductase